MADALDGLRAVLAQLEQRERKLERLIALGWDLHGCAHPITSEDHDSVEEWPEAIADLQAGEEA